MFPPHFNLILLTSLIFISCSTSESGPSSPNISDETSSSEDSNSSIEASEAISSSSSVETSWDSVKNNTFIQVALTQEYNEPTKLPISTLGWEDGINISRDGLNIYATYIPADFLSFVLNENPPDPSLIPNYDRGPHYDMDFTTNPAGVNYPWYQSDIIYASRSTTEEEFTPWFTSSMKRHSYSEGALSTVFSSTDEIDICAFTSNDEYTAQNNIKIIRNTTANPTGLGTSITSTDLIGTSSINTNHIEDNPHIERINDNQLVLFFDSEDRPGGLGSIDLWYSTSNDNGSTWTTPTNVTSINTSSKEHQPHLYHDGSDWWIYYSATHSDSKLAIYRAKNQSVGTQDWNQWSTPEVVLTAGNSEGIGEPTLTENGDLYFVTIYKNETGNSYDQYDADAWVALRK